MKNQDMLYLTSENLETEINNSQGYHWQLKP